MTTPDYITLLLYGIGIFVISSVAAKRTSNTKDMFAAGGKSPWWASGLSGFMTMFSAGTFVVWGGVAYELGLVAILINLCYGIAALLVGYFVAGRWNSIGVETPAEYVRLRFGITGLHFFTWTMLIKRILGVSVSLYALAVMLVALMPFDLTLTIVVFGGIVVLYTMQGGLWAVLMTDVLQFIVLTAVVLMVAALMVTRLIGNEITMQDVPSGFLLPTAGSYGWFFLLGWVTIHFFMIGAEWAFVQRFIAVKNPQDARKSCYLFGFMYLLTPAIWLLPPLLFRLEQPDVDKEQAYILAARSVLPSGVMGLMCAAMFSATASMVSSQLNVFAGVLTNDFYRPFLNPKANSKTLLFVGRCFTVLLGIFLVTTATLVPYLGGAAKLIISINSLLVVPLFAPTLWGLFSKKVGLREMIVVALCSFSLGVCLRFGIAQNAWISPDAFLGDTKNWLASHKETVDLSVGVILPVFMLLVFELGKRSKDPGFEALRLHSSNHRKTATTNSVDSCESFDPFPARMVAISMFVIGLWIAVLALLESNSRLTVLTVGVIMIGLSAAVHTSVRRQLRKTHLAEVDSTTQQ